MMVAMMLIRQAASEMVANLSSMPPAVSTGYMAFTAPSLSFALATMFVSAKTGPVLQAHA
jgi:hypothetical protein